MDVNDAIRPWGREQEEPSPKPAHATFWPDQRNALAMYENPPDTFALPVLDDGDRGIRYSHEGSNEHGEMGEVPLHWSSPGWWVAWGDSSVGVRDTFTVLRDLRVGVEVHSVEAGNLEAPRRPIACTDNSNDIHLGVAVPGRVHWAG